MSTELRGPTMSWAVLLFFALALVCLGEVQLASAKVIALPLKSSRSGILLNHIGNGNNQTDESQFLRKRYNVAAPLEGCASNDFAVRVELGNPSNSIEMIVDTGSTTLATASTLCACGPGDSYSPGPSAINTGSTTSSSYGDGSGWSGTVYTDDVGIAGITPVRMNFAAITSESGFFNREGCQSGSPPEYRGILGMGYPSLLQGTTESFFDELMSSGQLDSDVFTIQMCQNTGYLWLGGYDPEYMSGQILYTPVTSQTYWVVDMSDLQIDGYSLGYTSFGTSIVDSGTTLLSLPTNIFNAFEARITSISAFNRYFPSDFFTGGYCNTVPGETDESINSMFPPFSITIGRGPNAIKLSMTAVSSYFHKVVDNGNVFYCPGIAPSSDPFTIMGWSVMNQFTTVFDRQNNRVGFAVTRGCPDSSAFSLKTTSGLLMGCLSLVFLVFSLL